MVKEKTVRAEEVLDIKEVESAEKVLEVTKVMKVTVLEVVGLKQNLLYVKGN